MNTTIKKIVIFNKGGDKRFISFNDGLNIITGDSKTGKSALIEIVDYCLFSSRSSIPVGKITEFASLFITIFKVNDFYIIVGRPAPNHGNTRTAYLNVELDYSVLENLELSYFDKLHLKPIKDDVQVEFEQYLGLSMNKLDIKDSQSSGKLSIRDTVSFLFQHQNLIANKHALFYRFDDIHKRKRVIEALPVLMGVADAEYYELIKRQRELNRLKRNEIKLLNKLKTQTENKFVRIRQDIEIYYSLIGFNLDQNLTNEKLKKIGLELPKPPKIIGDQTKMYLKITSWKKERELKYLEKESIEKTLAALIDNSNDSLSYAKSLKEIELKQKYTNSLTTDNHISCPLCENPVEDLNDEIAKIEKSKEKLLSELSKLTSFAQDNTQVINSLNKKKKKVDSEIRRLSKGIKLLTQNDKKIQADEKKRERIFGLKGRIETMIEEQLNSKEIDSDLKKWSSELEDIEDKLKKYKSLEDFNKEAETTLKIHMDRIADKLDFEKELKPVNFFFDLKDFSFKHEHDGAIRLDEMGSGANWLACHISVFLAFMYLRCKNKKSVIPTFLMIDQPSQVYFPRTTRKEELEDEDEKNAYDDNIEQVKKIFRVLKEEIDLIYSKHQIKPQIIVLEHANDPDFKEHILLQWNKKKGEGLI